MPPRSTPTHTSGTSTRRRAGSLGRTQAAEVGMNFYIRGHNLKVQTNYTYFDKEASGTSNRYQLQLQLDF